MVDTVLPPLGVGGGAIRFPAHVQDVVEEVEDDGLMVAVLLGLPDMVSQRDDSGRCWLPVCGFDECDPLAGLLKRVSRSRSVAGPNDQVATRRRLTNVFFVNSSGEVRLGVE